jgi:hypothetical protein
MKTYEVTIEHIAYRTLTVEAENEEQAEEFAWKLYDGFADDCASNNIFSVEEMDDE